MKKKCMTNNSINGDESIEKPAGKHQAEKRNTLLRMIRVGDPYSYLCKIKTLFTTNQMNKQYDR